LDFFGWRSIGRHFPALACASRGDHLRAKPQRTSFFPEIRSTAGSTVVPIQRQPVSLTAGQCLPAARPVVNTLISLRIYA
jgi:hypothetical protein